MQPIKLSNSVEFDVIYADGSRRRVTEGVLFEAYHQRMIFHKGTSRKEVIFATAEALNEVITDMRLLEEACQHLEKAEEIQNAHMKIASNVIGSKKMPRDYITKETVCDKCGRDVTTEEHAKIQLWSPGRPAGGQKIDLCLGCYLKLLDFLKVED